MRLAPLALAATVLAGCVGGPQSPPPTAEFLVATADSTFWVRADSAGLHLRGSPLQLARVDGRYYELYVTDDDRSSAEGVFASQRVYRRDLLSGDSAVVYRDTIVGPIAAAWERRHPEAVRLLPDEPANENPDTRATAEIEFLDVHGPWLSLELHLDVDGRNAAPAHDIRRAVADLRTGRAGALADLFGAGTARSLAAAGRAALAGASDSVLNRAGEFGEHAKLAVEALRFDETSFSLETVGGGPAVAFLVPGGQVGAGGITLPLAPIRAAEPAWWTAQVRGTIATAVEGTGPGRTVERWQRPRYELVVRSDTVGSAVALALRDTARREFAIGRIHGEVRHVFWLDAAPLDTAARRALVHAFDEAAFYSDDVKTASREVAPCGPRAVLTPAARDRRPSPVPRSRHRRARRRQVT